MRKRPDTIEGEYCTNSKQWIELMILKGDPPESCPHQKQNFLHCEGCSYYKMKFPTEYLIRKRVKISEGTA